MRVARIVAIVMGALLLSACGPALVAHTAAIPQVSRATIVMPQLGSDDVEISDKLRIKVDAGRLKTVQVTDAKGREVTGDIGHGATRWVAAPGALDFDTTYEVSVEAVDLRGAATSMTGEFHTIEPAEELSAEIYPPAGQTYGVGIPIVVTFNHEVVDRAAVESALKVKTSARVNGSWHWDGPTKVTYRTEKYWPANTEVTVQLNLRGVAAAEGLYGTANVDHSFDIGSSTVSLVDSQTRMMTVWRDGEVLRTIPITTGKPGWETRSGVKVIMSKERLVIMDAATLGVGEDDEEYYRLEVPYAMRVTWSGEFVHAAPWSVAAQGRDNVSHGCVGMNLDNAAWLFNESKIGDIVEVTGTGRPQDLGNGITVWNESWADWKAGSAL